MAQHELDVYGWVSAGSAPPRPQPPSHFPDSGAALRSPARPIPGPSGPDSRTPEHVSRLQTPLPPIPCLLRHEVSGSRQSRPRTKPKRPPPPQSRAARSRPHPCMLAPIPSGAMPPSPAPACDPPRAAPLPAQLPPVPQPPARGTSPAEPARSRTRAPYPPLRSGTGVLPAVPKPSQCPRRPRTNSATRAHRTVNFWPPWPLCRRRCRRRTFFSSRYSAASGIFFFFFTCPLQLPLVIGD